MNSELLQQLGLTASQAKTYIELIKAGNLTPPQLARKTGESRTAAYMALAKLEEIGLAKRSDSTKKQTYAPTNPATLEQFITKQRDAVTEVEETYRKALPNLLSYYFTFRSEPGVRFYQGEDGLKKIYEDILRTRQPTKVVRTPADEAYFGPLLYKYMDQRAQLGIETDLLAPANPEPMQWAKDHDARLKRQVTWFPVGAYTAPVEISIYGNKVALISFGDEAVGTVIESPQIAQAMRELYEMAKLGADTLMKQKK